MPRAKRKYSSLTLEDALQLVEQENFASWPLTCPPREPSALLLGHLQRLEAFDLQTTEMAKALLIDALLAEIVPLYPQLKVWKAAPLETDELTGVADYVIAPKRAYLATPLLAVAEAKRDDFVQGRAQCLAELAACRWQNAQRGFTTPLYGIVSNGQVWQFYHWDLRDAVQESGLFTTDNLPELLGILDHICAACAANAPT